MKNLPLQGKHPVNIFAVKAVVFGHGVDNDLFGLPAEWNGSVWWK